VKLLWPTILMFFSYCLLLFRVDFEYEGLDRKMIAGCLLLVVGKNRQWQEQMRRFWAAPECGHGGTAPE